MTVMACALLLGIFLGILSALLWDAGHAGLAVGLPAVCAPLAAFLYRTG